MKQQIAARRRPWRALTDAEKRALVADIRDRQQAQIEREVRRLRDR